MWRTLQAVSDWIRVADAKAGAALAVDGVMLALFTTRLRGSPPPAALATIGLSVAIALATVSALLAIWTVVPRTRRLRADSLIHYGRIAAFPTAPKFHDIAVANLADTDQLARALTEHIWTISRSAVRKYRLVTHGIHLLVGAMILGLVSLLIG